MGPEGEGDTGYSKGVEQVFNIVGKKPGVHNEVYNYDSVFRTYGFNLDRLEDGSYYLSPDGVANKVDRVGDRVLRRWDDHIIKRPSVMLEKEPRKFIHFARSKGKRARGEIPEILENIRRLHLDDYYEGYGNGIRIKKPEILDRGINLQDVYEVDNESLKQLDFSDAMKKAGKYIRSLLISLAQRESCIRQEFFFKNSKVIKLWIRCFGFLILCQTGKSTVPCQRKKSKGLSRHGKDPSKEKEKKSTCTMKSSKKK